MDNKIPLTNEQFQALKAGIPVEHVLTKHLPEESIPKLREWKHVSKESNPLNTQIGGDHYSSMAIQPLEFAIANGLDFFQKDVIKYVTRRKGNAMKRIEDLKKARHYLDIYIATLEENPSWGNEPK